ncbi:MAG: HesB/IscA family protein [Halodesulfurarchaeum sp.]
MSSTQEPAGRSAPFEVTERAATAARTVLEEEGFDPEEASLRVIARKKDCECGDLAFGLQVAEHPKPSDHTLERDGLSVVVDERSTPHLQGVTLDYIDDFRGEGFTIHSPESGGGCGCGHSH